MAWNFEYIRYWYSQEGETTWPPDVNAAITPEMASKVVTSNGITWVLTFALDIKSHQLSAFPLRTSPENKDIDAPGINIINPVAVFTSSISTDDFLVATTIAADGDTCYVGMADWSESWEGFPRRPVAWSDPVIGRTDDYKLKTEFTSILVCHSWGEKSAEIKTPVLMNGDIVVADNKLWMATYYEYGGVNRLYNYDLSTKEWNYQTIPVKFQYEPHVLAYDRLDNIIHCDYNNLSVTKFPISGGAPTTIRLAAIGAAGNREPNAITVSLDGTIYVASFQGLISRIDPVTNVVTSYTNGLGRVHSFVDDGTYIWAASSKRPTSVSHQGSNYTCVVSHMSESTLDIEKWARGGDGAGGAWTSGTYYVDDKEDLIRITKSTKQIRHFSSDNRDIQIEPVRYLQVDTKVNSLAVTPVMNGLSDSVLIWAIMENNTLMVLPNTPMFRPNYFVMDGVAMMSYGPYDYIGE